MADEHQILLIEDDPEIASTLRSVLEGAGYHVTHAKNGIEGQEVITSSRPDMIITDMMMPKLGGFPVLDFLQTIDDPPPVIMMTANEGSRHKAYAEMLGVVDYLRKPFAMDVLLESVARALGQSDADGTAQKSAGPLKRSSAKKAP